LGQIKNNLAWADIVLDTSSSKVVVRQRWKYVWKLASGETAWTNKEKEAFHTNFVALILKTWSSKITIIADGDKKSLGDLEGKSFPITFAISHNKPNPHWTVNVTKIKKGSWKGSKVLWTRRIMHLDSQDLHLVKKCTVPNSCRYQAGGPHEFGHAIGNTIVLNRGDEYKPGRVGFADKDSVMNLGMKVRERHFSTIIDALNKMVPKVTFKVKSGGGA